MVGPFTLPLREGRKIVAKRRFFGEGYAVTLKNLNIADMLLAGSDRCSGCRLHGIPLPEICSANFDPPSRGGWDHA
jgi:hypothetical protein